MHIGLLFWILYIVAIVFGAMNAWPAAGTAPAWRGAGFSLLLFVLLGLLGWGIFGAPIKG